MDQRLSLFERREHRRFCKLRVKQDIASEHSIFIARFEYSSKFSLYGGQCRRVEFRSRQLDRVLLGTAKSRTGQVTAALPGQPRLIGPGEYDIVVTLD